MRHRRSKYNAKQTWVDGILFDSMREANRYKELKLLLDQGEISDLQMQVKYELIPAQYEVYERYGKRGQRLKDGKKLLERPVTYIADFVYYDVPSNKVVVEDCKGMRDEKYRIKKKLMLWVKGIRIKET